MSRDRLVDGELARVPFKVFGQYLKRLSKERIRGNTPPLRKEAPTIISEDTQLLGIRKDSAICSTQLDFCFAHDLEEPRWSPR